MEPCGLGKKKILIVGEAPGEREDKKGVQFVGKAGKEVLRPVLRELGINPERDVVMTNALICHPPNNVITNKKAIEFCRPNLLKTINEMRPEIIILLGKSPVKSLIGHLWKESVGDMKRWAGWQIPSQTFNTWICPIYHPSYLLRQDSVVLNRIFFAHMRDALALEGRPWDKVPDYKSQVQVEFNAKRAAKEIRILIKGKRPVAFDYETNMLKPDSKRGRIVCCSVSDGKTTIAFPWDGEAIDAMVELLRSDVGKIASNMKFEDRWTKKKLKIRIRNWLRPSTGGIGDTMLAAHVLDNRPLISSIKFQAFVKLGQEDYDSHLKPYLKSKDPGGYSENRITEINMSDLLVYNGLDSLLEWKVAKIQYKEFTHD